MSVLEWLVNRGLDAEIARGELPPVWMSAVGIVLIVVALLVLGWLVRRARAQRREEHDRPAPGNLLDARPWLAIDPYTVEPVREVFYRGRRRAPRNHVVPAHPSRAEPVTQVIPRVSDEPDATIAIPKTYGGAR